jgi:hypothetical protein
MIATLATSQNWKKKPWLTPCYPLVIGITLISELGNAEYCTHFFDQNLIQIHMTMLAWSADHLTALKQPHATKMKRNEILRKKIEKQMDRIQECKEVTENITGNGGGTHPSHHTQSK